MRVSAIVVNWNGGEHLGPCLDALLAQDHPDLEVVVVDNASTDGSRAVAERLAARPDTAHPVRVLANPHNRGYAGAANDGIAATTGEVVVVANFDVRPRPDYLRRAVAALAADPRRGAVQGKLLRAAPSPRGEPVIDTTGHVAFRTRLFRNRGEGEVDRGQWDRPGEVFGVSGALAVYRRALLDDVGVPRLDPPTSERAASRAPEVFDEDLFAFWEDVDLDWRAALRGWTAWYEPTAVAHHERGGAGPRRDARVEQLNWQNRLLTVIKCDAPRELVRALPGVVLTTVLKTGELAVTVPRALIAGLSGWRLVPRFTRKRHHVQAHATVPADAVVRRWFTAFDYGAWVRTWWRRVRGVPPGA